MQQQFGPPYGGGHQAGAGGGSQGGAGGGSQLGAGGGISRAPVASYQGAQQHQPQNRLLLTDAGNDPGAFYRS